VGLDVTLYNAEKDLAQASVSDTATITVNEDTGTVSVAAEGSWQIQ
jgi:DNA integrity scanning protein DisA with diadenylate cyclase activity